MSPKLGPVRHAGDQLRYLGSTVEDNSQISQETRHLIDEEVQAIVTEQYERACAPLTAHSGALETLARELLEQETVDGNAVQRALYPEGAGDRGEPPVAATRGELVEAAHAESDDIRYDSGI